MNCSRALVLGLVVGVAGTAVANHDESVGARFVQPGGVDAGNCLDHHAPCVSIQYALAQAEPGNSLKVGAGIFDLSGVDPETFVHGPVHATGGYGDADHYYESRPLEVQSIVVGVDARYRNALALRGFYWAESVAAAQRNEISFAGGAALQQTQSAAAQCVQGMAGLFPCRNLDFLSQIPLAQFSSRPVSAANVWGFVDLNDNREYAVVGLRNGTAIVEVTDPENPREVVTIPGNASPWREVKVYQMHDGLRWRAYAYVTTEAANSGVQIIDMSLLPQTAVFVSANMDTSSQHTLYVSNIDYSTNAALPGATPMLFIAGSKAGPGSWRVYSLANPKSPQFVSAAPLGGYMHDSTSLLVTDARTAQCATGHNPCEVLVDFNVEQVQLWDVTNELQPMLLGSATNPNNRYIHSGWPTATRNASHLIFHDELEEIQLGLPTRLYTLGLANLSAPTVQISYSGPTTTTDHNGYMRGTNYYVSHYRRGIVVFDAANPNALVEIGHFDNYLSPSTNSAGTDGAWGVYPFLPSGSLLVSDIENGLFVLRDQTRSLDAGSGRLGFAALSLATAENAGGIDIRVQRTVGRAGEISLQYATSGGSATDGIDYRATTGTLSWAPGDLADKVIVVPIVDDTSVEGAETFTVTLAVLTGGATFDGSSTLTITIDDNDSSAPRSTGGGGGGSSDFMLLVLLAGVLLARFAAQPRRPALR